MGSGTVGCVRRAARASLRRGMRGDMWLSITVAVAVVATLALVVAPVIQAAQAAPVNQSVGPLLLQSNSQWPAYLQNISRSGFNGAETKISPSSAASLTQRWAYATTMPVSAEPVEANNMVYVGSWDGNERALTTSGQVVWTTFIGQTSDSACVPTLAGVASTPFVTQSSSGIRLLQGRSMLYVGGGDGQIYALDALKGTIVWNTRLGPSPATFIWSSPLVYGGSVYIGVASLGDCPLVQGQLVKLNATTGAVQHVFDVVPNGCTGGGVWSSPTLDAATGLIYFDTGNDGGCSTSEPYSTAVVALHASDLSLASSWQIPPAQQIEDGDFGATPTLFTATIGGVARSLVGAVAKSGIYYAFDRTNVGAGPVWMTRIDNGGDCPQCGAAAIAPTAWDGQTLYAASGVTTIGGKSCAGSIQALNPATGTPRWQTCLSAAVLGAVTAVHGVVFVGVGAAFSAFAASSGASLFSFTDTSGQPFWGAASVADGSVYIGNMDGTLFCFTPSPATVPAV